MRSRWFEPVPVITHNKWRCVAEHRFITPTDVYTLALLPDWTAYDARDCAAHSEQSAIDRCIRRGRKALEGLTSDAQSAAERPQRDSNGARKCTSSWTARKPSDPDARHAPRTSRGPAVDHLKTQSSWLLPLLSPRRPRPGNGQPSKLSPASLRRARPRLVSEKDVVAAPALEGWIEVDQVDGLVCWNEAV